MDEREQTLINDVAIGNLTTHNAEIAKGVRLSGSAAEAEAFAYLAAQCRAYGMDVRQYAVDAYVSLPGAASLAVIAPDAQTLPCITHSFGLATGAAGLNAPLVYVGAGKTDDYARADVRGKIALVDGLGSPPNAFAADRAGAVGMVCVNPEGLHEMIISPVWGTPTPETAPILPQLVAVSVRKETGDILKRLCAAGDVTVTLHAVVTTQWTSIPALTADLPGVEGDQFVLLSGHVDSWHYGAMDNASANATMLEVARVLSERRSDLRRGLRLAFWSGHSHARYGASAWYADTFWEDLHDHCVCHVNAESTGGMNALKLEPGNMAETWRFAAAAIRDVAGYEAGYRRMSRNSDQSFTGTGVPSAFSGLSSQPDGGLGWWWHTPDDTLDKIDPTLFLRDTQIYLLACWRLCIAPVLPFTYADAVEEVIARLAELQSVAGERFDLSGVQADAAQLLDATRHLTDAVADGGDAEMLNHAIVAVGRALIPVTYTVSGPYHVDLALDTPVLPGLDAVGDLAALPAGSDAAQFLAVRLVRERNRVQHALVQARQAIETALA